MLYILLQSTSNVFYSYDTNSNCLVTLPIIEEIGNFPSLILLSNSFILSIGGTNSSNICIYDIHNNKWTFIASCKTIRNGSYALYDRITQYIYICGGVNEDGDNSLDIEAFKLIYDNANVNTLSSTFYPCELELYQISNEFLLRRISPMFFEVDEGVYIICGGRTLLSTNSSTCVLCNLKEGKCGLLEDDVGIDVKGDNNYNSYEYKEQIYFFQEKNVYRYSIEANRVEYINRYTETDK